MPIVKNDHGGGNQTNINGFAFEQATSLDDAFLTKGYFVKDYYVYDHPMCLEPLGMSVPKHFFYSHFLIPHGIDYEQINSKKWLPDEAFVNFLTKTVYIIEKKFQNGRGSVDEKLPNCHFKKIEYEKLCHPIGYTVKFIYLLSDWFLRPQYKDTLDYILHVECEYYYNQLPFSSIGLKPLPFYYSQKQIGLPIST